MAGVGVENHLALDPEILDDPRCHIFRYLVRPSTLQNSGTTRWAST